MVIAHDGIALVFLYSENCHNLCSFYFYLLRSERAILKEKVYYPYFVKTALWKLCISSPYLLLFRNMGMKKSGILCFLWQKRKITAFTISYLILIPTTCFMASVVKYFYSQEFLQHIKAFSSKVVNSTCTLANILVFQGVWGLIIKVWEKYLKKYKRYQKNYWKFYIKIKYFTS